MKTNSRLSVFALQQRLSRPLTTVVLSVFTAGYLIYLTILLVINMQKGWFTVMEQPELLSLTEIYDFQYYFSSYDYSSFSRFFTTNYQTGMHIEYDSKIFLANSTTPFLIRSEIIFWCSVVSMVFALIPAHTKMNKGGETIRRLPVFRSTTIVMQWLSDFVYILSIWFSHLVVIFLFYLLYASLAPAQLISVQNLYSLFTGEYYLYMFFQVVNPVSIIRMVSLVLAISFLPSLVSYLLFDPDPLILKLTCLLILIWMIYWSILPKGDLGGIFACAAAMMTGILGFIFTLRKRV